MLTDAQFNTATAAVETLLSVTGHDVTSEGLRDTPRRYVKALADMITPPEFALTTFDAERYDDTVVVRSIPFYSLCEHHLLPFFGHAHIAYIPNGRILGLSKIPRIVEHHARKLQNQERLTSDIADMIGQIDPRPKGIAVVVDARHLCMEMRGVQSFGTTTRTTTFKGIFYTNPSEREQVLSLLLGAP